MIFIIFKFAFFATAILLFGYCLTVFLFKERRLFAVAPLTILLGFGSFVFLLNVYSYLFPIKILIWLLPILMGLAAIVFLMFFVGRSERRLGLGELSKKQSKILFLIAITIFTLSFIVASRTLELDDVSLTHIPLAKTISEGNFPVLDPSSPNHLLAYHYAPDLLAAAMHGFVGLPLWLSYDIQTAAFAVSTFLMAFLLAFYLVKKFKTSIFASLLLFYGGGLTWLYAMDGISPIWKKFVLHQNILAPFKFLSSMDIPQLNPNFIYCMGNHTTALGMPLMLLVIYLFFRLLDEQKRWKLFSISAGIILGYLALSLETNSVLLAFAFGLVLIRFIFKGLKDREFSLRNKQIIFSLAVILALGSFLAFFQGGPLSSFNQGLGYDQNSFHLSLKFWEIHWSFPGKATSIFSRDFMIEFGLWLILSILAFIYYRRNKKILILMLFALLAFLIPFFIIFPIMPWEISRVFLISTPVFSFVVGLYLGEFIDNQKIEPRQKKWAWLGIVLLMSYGALMQIVYLVYPIGATITPEFNKPLFAIPSSPNPIDEKALQWIKENTTIKDYFFPYNEDFIIWTGRFTPGPWEWSVQKEEIEQYQAIIKFCDAQAIKNLKINYFYVRPDFPVQNYLEKCRAGLRLESVFEEKSGEDLRIIYRVILNQ